MKLAIIGSRGLGGITLSGYIPADADEIISGGAAGIDTLAREYALAHGLRLTELLPEYERYGRRAPLVRNTEIVNRADAVLAFWDGRSHGTRFVIDECGARGVPVTVRVFGDPSADVPPSFIRLKVKGSREPRR